MGVEEEIARRMAMGWSPQRLQAEGFNRSTVYKVAATLSAREAAVPDSLLTVASDLTADRRFLPGENVPLSYTITNQSAVDFYVFQVGVQPEWLARPPLPSWFYVPQRKLLAPDGKLTVQQLLPIPGDETLGIKDLMIGIEGQFVGPTSASPSTETLWSGPMRLRVQHPPTGTRIFLSHSVQNMQAVNELARTLDDYGIETIIAEAIPTPGAVLSEKFTSLILQSQIVVGLLTVDSVRSQWVMAELSYAQQIHKPLILLRDCSLAGFPTPIDDLEWTEVDLSHGMQDVVPKLLSAMEYLGNTAKLPPAQSMGMRTEDAVFLGLLAFAAGALIVGGSNRGGGSAG